jgi:hypothetical protein
MKKMMAINCVVLAMLMVFAACNDLNGGPYKITLVSGGNGELVVTPSAALVSGVAAGTVISLRSAPMSGYRLKEGSVTVNGAALGVGTLNFTIGADSVVGAEFVTLNTRAVGSAAEFAMIGRNDDYPLNGTYYLSNDIILGNEAWTPIGSTVKKFTGNFDGNGYAIKNLHLGNGATHNGLFGWAVYADIKNFTLELANNELTLENEEKYYIGAVAGFASNTEFNNITVNAAVGGALAVTCSGGEALYTGGIAGYAEGCAFSGMRVTLSLSAENNGMVYAGGVAGAIAFYSSIADSETTGAVSSAQLSSTKNAKVFAGGVAGSLEGSAINKSNASGSIDAIVNSANTGISLEAYSGGIVGYTISSAITESDYTNREGTVKVENSGGGNGIFVGGIAGYADTSALFAANSTGTIEAKISGISSTSAYAGGITGYTTTASPIINCTANGVRVSAERTVVNNGAAYVYAGGIAGWARSVISQSRATGTVMAERNGTTSSNGNVYAGGIVGESGADISECYSDCTVSALAGAGVTTANWIYAGGIVANSQGNSNSQPLVAGCYAKGDVTASSESTSSVNVWVSAGGIIGVFDGFTTIENCYAAGDITGRSSNTGATVSEAVASTNGLHVGGIFGVGIRAKVSSCYASGTITAERAGVGYIYAGSIGGLVNNVAGGGGNSWVQNCAARSPVVTASGSNNSSVNVYISRIATVVGYGSALTSTVAADCYFANNFALSNMTLTKNNSSLALESANKALDKKDGLDKIAATLATRSTYETDLGWDFANTWNWTAGGPTLRMSN